MRLRGAGDEEEDEEAQERRDMATQREWGRRKVSTPATELGSRRTRREAQLAEQRRADDDEQDASHDTNLGRGLRDDEPAAADGEGLDDTSLHSSQGDSDAEEGGGDGGGGGGKKGGGGPSGS